MYLCNATTLKATHWRACLDKCNGPRAKATYPDIGQENQIRGNRVNRLLLHADHENLTLRCHISVSGSYYGQKGVKLQKK